MTLDLLAASVHTARLFRDDFMALRLFVLPEYPDQFAATKSDYFVIHGVFFLDFSRPLKPLRKAGVLNRWFGSPIGLLVPLVHQGEQTGEFVTGIHCSDPCFADLIALWRVRYRSRRPPPAREVDALKIIADFTEQFQEDSQLIIPASHRSNKSSINRSRCA